MAQPYSGGARAPKKNRKRGSGGIGPDGPRYRGPGYGDLNDNTVPGRRSGIEPGPKKLNTWQYGNRQNVQGGVKKRARRRLKAVGGVEGVNAKDGITGREARKIRRSWVAEGRPRPGSGNGNGGTRNPNRSGRNPRPTPLLDALTELQYGGQVRELDAQRRISDQHSTNMSGWYQDYLNRSQQAQAQQAAYTQGFQAAAYQQANQAAMVDTGQNQQLLAQQNQQAAQRGMTVDPSVAQTLQGGVAARQATGTAMGGLLAAQGQAQTAYLGNRVAVAGQQGIQAQQDEQRKKAQIDQLAQDLQREMGAFKVKTKMDLREQRHTRRLENAAFGLDQAEFAADVADDRADNRRLSKAERRQQREARSRIRDRRQDNIRDQQRLSLDERKEQRMRDQDLADDGRLNGSSGGSSGGKSFTPTQVRSGRKSLRNLVGRVKNNVDPPDSVDPLLARAAVQIADNGGVSPKLARQIKRQYGFTPKINRKSWQEREGKKGIEGIKDAF
jgi:hypothetical protein